MTIRWKLNLLVSVLIAIFLVTVALVMYAGRLDERATLHYEGTVGLSQFTSDVRSSIYLHLAADANATPLPPGLHAADWPLYLLEDITVRIRLSDEDTERRLWTAVRETIAEIDRLQVEGAELEVLTAPVQRVVHDLRLLRNDYDRRSADLQAVMAKNHFRSYAAVWTATILTISLMLIHLIMVRRWLVTPISRLIAWSDTTGSGVLDRPVALEGQDELAELARHMGVMAERLAHHQKALVEARELSAIGEVCGNIAHGLRNPLASIRTCVQLAQRDPGVSESLGETLARLLAQADRMDERITRMFEFSKPVDLDRKGVTFATLASLARTDAQPQLHDASVNLEILDSTGDTSWLVDSNQIGCVLAELITNATYHSDHGASVRVSGTVLPAQNGSAAQLRIQVIDEGVGVPAATMDKVFDLFFTGRPDGTGVGLALADRIIRQHDGEIHIESTLGSGTTVTLTLPGEAAGQHSHRHDPPEAH